MIVAFVSQLNCFTTNRYQTEQLFLCNSIRVWYFPSRNIPRVAFVVFILLQLKFHLSDETTISSKIIYEIIKNKFKYYVNIKIFKYSI